MHVLVVGASGLLGSNIVSTLYSRGDNCTGTYHSTAPDLDIPLRRLDIKDKDMTRRVIESVSPDVVINCGAMTDVDACESDPEQAHAINAEAPGAVGSICAEYGIKMVHVSTDYVFDGSASEPYAEEAALDPIQVYGESKALGEQRVRENTQAVLIVRPSFIYGIHRGTDALTGFPVWVRDQLLSDSEVTLFTDQHVTPSRAGSTASAVLDLIDAGESGTFHVACRSCVTPYEFGKQLRRQLGAPEELLVKSSMADVDREASRPPYTCLKIDKIEESLGRPQPTLSNDLQAIGDKLAEL